MKKLIVKFCPTEKLLLIKEDKKSVAISGFKEENGDFIFQIEDSKINILESLTEDGRL